MLIKTLSGELILLNTGDDVEEKEDSIRTTIRREFPSRGVPRLVQCEKANKKEKEQKEREEEDEKKDELSISYFLFWDHTSYHIPLHDPDVQDLLLRSKMMTTIVNDDIARSFLHYSPNDPRILQSPHPILVEHILNRLNDETCSPTTVELSEILKNPADEVIRHPRVEKLLQNEQDKKYVMNSLLHHMLQNHNPHAATLMLPYLRGRQYLSIHALCSSPHIPLFELAIEESTVVLVLQNCPFFPNHTAANALLWEYREQVEQFEKHFWKTKCGRSTDEKWMDHVRNESDWPYLAGNPHPYAVEYVLPRLLEMTHQTVSREDGKTRWLCELNRNPAPEMVHFLLDHRDWIVFPHFVYNANPMVTDLQKEYLGTTAFQKRSYETILSSIQNPELMEWLLVHPEVVNAQTHLIDRLMFLGKWKDVPVE